MAVIVVAVFAVVSIVAVAAVSERIGVAAPLSLVLVGIALSFVLDLEHVNVRPEWILSGVLPPLLYAAAVRMPALDFRRDIKTISGLAVLLVALTTVGAGLLFNSVLPGLGLAAAFALGAVISPTDAVAATSVGQKLGLPARLLTILEGEGLVNDASSLVLLSSAVAAFTSEFHLWKVGLDFVYAVAVAAAVGAVVGFLSVRVRMWLRDPVLNTAISFVVPFFAFVPAEETGASGVLAVVVAGLVAGNLAPRHLPAQDRLAEAINWRTISFLLESGIFLLMGLQLDTILHQASDAGLSVADAVWIGLAASALAVVLRLVFVAPLVAGLRKDAHQAAQGRPILDRMEARLATADAQGKLTEQRKEHLDKRIARAASDMEFRVKEGFGWRGGLVLAWAGMRGAVTVAAAQSLPDDTPLRPQLLLIAFVVAGTTLLVQGLTLPRVIRAVKVPGDDPAVDRQEYATLLTELAEAGAQVLDDPDLTAADGAAYPLGVVDRVREDARVQATHQAAEGETAPTPDQREQYRELMGQVLEAERTSLLNARAMGLYRSRTISRAMRALDVEELRLQRTTFDDTTSTATAEPAQEPADDDTPRPAA